MATAHQEATRDSPTVAETLAQWALAIDSADLPMSEIKQAKLLLLDSIGCAIAAKDEPVCQKMVSLCDELGRDGPCTVIGQSRAIDLPHAILANGTLVRMLDLNDYVIDAGKNGPEIGGHPSDNIPVALAAGEASRRSGRDILAAIVIGYEVFGRLKVLMDRKGAWDGVTISGFVAPVMAGRLMGLDAARLSHALALSGTRAATPALVRHGGISAAKSIANALVAQSAMEATLFAEQGITGPLAILEHKRGMSSVFPSGDIAAAMAAAFPAGSYIMKSNVKAYPCVATGQAAVAAALKLHEQLGGNVSQLERIEVFMIDHPFVRDQQEDPKRVRPQSREAADHSFQYLVAAALTDGRFGSAQFEGDRWREPGMVALMNKIVMHSDPELNMRAPGTYPCVIRVYDQDQKVHTAEVLSPPGSSQGGIAEQDVVEKFHAAAAALDAAKRSRIIEAVRDFDRASTAESLTSALRA